MERGLAASPVPSRSTGPVAMAWNSSGFVQSGGSASAAVTSARSLPRRSKRGHGSRLHMYMLRFALVILCLPRTDCSVPGGPGVPGVPGCRNYGTVQDAFFATDLSSRFFPHNGYTPVPDPDPSECDFNVNASWRAGKSLVDMRAEIKNLGGWKTICVSPGTCEWTAFEPGSHRSGGRLIHVSLVPCQTRALPEV